MLPLAGPFALSASERMTKETLGKPRLFIQDVKEALNHGFDLIQFCVGLETVDGVSEPLKIRPRRDGP